MDINMMIEILKTVGAPITELINQVAWFLAIGAASKWLSITFPCLILFSVFIRMGNSMQQEDKSKEGELKFLAWILVAVTIYTGVRGTSHVMQAAFAPTVYIATEFKEASDLLKAAGGK
jgi:hypothetical protein